MAGLAPLTKEPVHTAKPLAGRKMRRALMPFFKLENDFEVRDALIQAGRADLIGGFGGLISVNSPKEALEKQRAVEGDHYRTVANPVKGEKPGERGAVQPKPPGYRPGRKS